MAAPNPSTPSASPSTPPPTIDHLFYPHLFDQIIADAPHSALVQFRQTCSDLKARIDARFGSHLVVWERTPLPQGLRVPGGGTLPLLHGRDLSWLEGTRVLDIPGAVHAVSFSKILQAVRELEVLRTYDRHAMLLPSLRFASAWTYVRFLSMRPTDRHPCVPLGCRKVVINVDYARGGGGEGMLVDFGYMSRGVEELVVVFAQPPRDWDADSASEVETSNANIVALGDAVGCHPWLLHQLLSLARYVPRGYVQRLVFVNLVPTHSPLLEGFEGMLGRILNNRLAFTDALVPEETYSGHECRLPLQNIEFVSMHQYASRIGPRLLALETDSSAFTEYERLFEEENRPERAKL
jgi:hypothetical protein